jgi:LysR family hydrogen peroxide-inducible transcriptional activator
VETLKRIVEQGDGLTILPELAIADFRNKQLNMVRYFREPEPIREICMITHRNFVKRQLIKVLSDEISESVPAKLQKKNKRKIIGLEV